ncbi:hypothetical protein FHG87_006536 [Trinorchestia longiramus]|nr:hypothetical protein FHG87_006536 [Trinorchestia longiramus]
MMYPVTSTLETTSIIKGKRKLEGGGGGGGYVQQQLHHHQTPNSGESKRRSGEGSSHYGWGSQPIPQQPLSSSYHWGS